LIVDTGVLLAAADRADPDHRACAELQETAASALCASPLVVAETAYLIGRRLGPAAEARFFRSIADGEISVEPLTGTDLARIAELVETYVDIPLGGGDASVVAIAGHLGETVIATLDRRHCRPPIVTTKATFRTAGSSIFGI